MKIEIAQKQLESLLTTTYKAISNKPTQPILGCFLVQADAKAQKVTVTGYNGRLSITTQVDCKVSAGGTLALNARLLSELVSSINGTLGLEVTDKQAVITHGTGRCRMPSLTAIEFPELPQVKGKTIALPTQTLKEAFGATLFAAAKDETKQILAGIHLQVAGANWECAATDGHRLGVSSSNEIESFDHAVTIPQATIACLKEILSNTTENCQITVGNNAICFNLPHICLISSLLEGSYPLYKSLIPKQFDYHFNINKNSLRDALERVAIVSSNKDKIVQVTFTSEQATLYAESADVGDAIETVSVSSTDKATNITFGFNAKYFLEALRAIPTTDVLIEAIAPTYPVILSPIGVGKVGRQIALIMPVQLKEIKAFTTGSKPIVDETEAVLV